MTSRAWYVPYVACFWPQNAARTGDRNVTEIQFHLKQHFAGHSKAAIFFFFFFFFFLQSLPQTPGLVYVTDKYLYLLNRVPCVLTSTNQSACCHSGIKLIPKVLIETFHVCVIGLKVGIFGSPKDQSQVRDF